MSDEVRQVTRNEQTVVAGTPEPVAVAPVVPAAVTPVQAVPPVAEDRVVQHQVAVSDMDPAAEKAANIGWVNSLIWFIAGLIIAVLAIRFVLAMTGADPHAGFAALIYGLSGPFRAPFAGLFGQPITYDGAVTAGRVEFEDLVAMVVYALIGWGLTRLLALLLGTNRTTTTVYTDSAHRTRL